MDVHTRLAPHPICASFPPDASPHTTRRRSPTETSTATRGSTDTSCSQSPPGIGAPPPGSSAPAHPGISEAKAPRARSPSCGILPGLPPFGMWSPPGSRSSTVASMPRCTVGEGSGAATGSPALRRVAGTDSAEEAKSRRRP